ncbi:MAG: 16S rRNA (adenine(1518)-N(6)/adenine(1519)-N(6))-dimethyltransferase RsmA, partial [Clostridia bacterium]|nr:16S rRNA (adenine(1518)-N(6)/adenine(1519)-N(6))-dimethyltransferase RsmA [Clostridia bacterium]
MNLSSPAEIKALLEKNGFRFSKALGQNFLINPGVCPRMAEAAVPGPEYGVIEVGPGIGVLTVELAQRAAKVVAIELDRRLFPILEETLADCDNVRVHEGDVLETDLKQLIADEFTRPDGTLMPLVLCANLPYYITSPVLMKLLSEDLPLETITVMVQKEAADRLCADVGTRAAGAVTVAIQYYAEAEQLFFVSKGSFLPAPKVDSEVIRLTLRRGAGEGEDFDEAAFFRMVQAGFSQRRKTIMNSFSAALNMSKEDLGAMLDTLGISRTARIEQLTMEQLLAVYKASR